MRSPSTSGASGWLPPGALVKPIPPPPGLGIDLPPTISSSCSAGTEVTPRPMPQCASISAVRYVAENRSPETPEELSSPKNIRSPAREASETMMSASCSDFQRVNWSSGLMLATMPR